MDDVVDDPASLYAKGCAPDVVLVLRDTKGNTVCRLRAVKAILAAWSPVLRGAIELGASSTGSGQDLPTAGPLHSSSSSSCLTSYGTSNCSIIPSAGCSSPAAGMCSSGDCNTTTGSSSNMVSQATASALISSSSSSWGGLELPILVDGHKEVEAWKVAVCLMHPLDPTCGKTPSSLITTCVIKPLVTLADKYNLQGLLPHCKDVLLDPRSSFGVPGIHDYYQLDALDWLQIAENVPGFEAVVSRCITQIVASATSSRGRSQRMAGSLDQPRYRGHEALVSAMAGLRPETCAKVTASLCSCLAVACENMANQDRYTIRPVGDHWWGWEYQYEPLRK